MKWLAVLTVVVFTGVTASATTRNVPAQYVTIQAGINAAATGDTVLVAPGTYTENISYGGKAIVIRSSGGRDITFIVAASQATPIVSFTSGEGIGRVLEGFTDRNVSGSYCIRCSGSSPTIRSCTIANSRQDGLNPVGNAPVVTGDTFQNNAKYLVWQAAASNPRLQKNTYIGNGVRAIRITSAPGKWTAINRKLMRTMCRTGC
ncbi:MAG: hypothetical protein HZB43_11785 [candidate division Zixibacteria bacterium]|nr:hypothetical protein [candidate division Zixibacteria bacterium]